MSASAIMAEASAAEELGSWKEEIDDRRHEAIQVLWERYQAGDFVVANRDARTTRLELVESIDLHVRSSLDNATGRINDVDIRNLGSPDTKGGNFLGYSETDRCVAFRGEARHLDSFLAFAWGIVKNEHVEHVFKAMSDVCFPEEGLDPGLEYDEFAGRVEIVEYAMWLKDIPDDQDFGQETMTIISFSKDGATVWPKSNVTQESDEPSTAQQPSDTTMPDMPPMPELPMTPEMPMITDVAAIADMTAISDMPTMPDMPIIPTRLSVLAEAAASSPPLSTTKLVPPPPAETRRSLSSEDELSGVPPSLTPAQGTAAPQVDEDAILAAELEEKAQPFERYSLRTRSSTRGAAGSTPVPPAAASIIPKDDETSEEAHSKPVARTTPRKKKGIAQRKKKSRGRRG